VISGTWSARDRGALRRAGRGQVNSCKLRRPGMEDISGLTRYVYEADVREGKGMEQEVVRPRGERLGYPLHMGCRVL
jgi:hypothetical protein